MKAWWKIGELIADTVVTGFNNEGHDFGPINIISAGNLRLTRGTHRTNIYPSKASNCPLRSNTHPPNGKQPISSQALILTRRHRSSILQGSDCSTAVSSGEQVIRIGYTWITGGDRSRMPPWWYMWTSVPFCGHKRIWRLAGGFSVSLALVGSLQVFSCVARMHWKADQSNTHISYTSCYVLASWAPAASGVNIFDHIP